jgi:DNA-binding transcriptional MerR regulator
MSEKIYGVKEITEITGLDRNRIYYWSRTLKAIRPEYITPGRRFYQLRAMLDFRLIAELQKHGLSPGGIEPILWQASEVPDPGQKAGDIVPSIWDNFLKERPKYEREGFFLRSAWVPGGDQVYVNFGEGEPAIVTEDRPYEFEGHTGFVRKESSLLIIDLLYIIHEVEEKTGERLE